MAGLRSLLLELLWKSPLLLATGLVVWIVAVALPLRGERESATTLESWIEYGALRSEVPAEKAGPDELKQLDGWFERTARFLDERLPRQRRSLAAEEQMLRARAGDASAEERRSLGENLLAQRELTEQEIRIRSAARDLVGRLRRAAAAGAPLGELPPPSPEAAPHLPESGPTTAPSAEEIGERALQP